MVGEYFQVRRLIWEDICQHIRPSEAEELRRAIGSYLIDDSIQLKRELGLLVEILSEYQQQSDCIREALMNRSQQRMPEPPGRALLVDKLKILATDLSTKNGERELVHSSKERELLKYVLSVDEGEPETWNKPPSTPRMAEVSTKGLPVSARDSILLRPGTSCGTRPSTASSSYGRPVSRGSTTSVSTTSFSIVESPEIRRRLNVDEIDSIKDEMQEALLEEKLQLLEDIEFIQSCVDMEQELLDDDRHRVATAKPPPTLQELHDLRRVLEKTLQEHEDFERVHTILSKAESVPSSAMQRRSHHLQPVSPSPISLPRPPSQDRHFPLSCSQNSVDFDDVPSTRNARGLSFNSNSATKVFKMRNAIQESRDEQFLT